MIEEIDLERLRNPAPIGILMLTILSVRALPPSLPPSFSSP